MIGFNSFDELAETVADYAHRADLVERVKTLFLPLAGVRIGRDLKSSSNEELFELDSEVDGMPMVLPADFGAIRSIVPSNGGPALISRDDIGITLMPKGGDRAIVYAIKDGAIEVRPTVSGKYLLSYYAAPVLDDNTPTNETLVKHPQVYLYAALVELQIWTQDARQRELALDAYNGDVSRINRAERRARQNAPQGVGSR